MSTVSQRIAESVARTVTETFTINPNTSQNGAFIIDITAGVTGTDTLTVSIQGFDPASRKWYNILVSTVLAAVATTVLRVGVDFANTDNLRAKDVLPRTFRIVATKNNTTSITYSIGANLSS